MFENRALSIQKVPGIAGASAAALMFAPHLPAMKTEKLRLRFEMLSDIQYASREPVGGRFIGSRWKR